LSCCFLAAVDSKPRTLCACHPVACIRQAKARTRWPAGDDGESHGTKSDLLTGWGAGAVGFRGTRFSVSPSHGNCAPSRAMASTVVSRRGLSPGRCGRQTGAAGALIPALGFAAARSQAAQLLCGFVRQHIRGTAHSASRHNHSCAAGTQTSGARPALARAGPWIWSTRRSAASLSWLQPAGRAPLFRTAEPGELGVQDVDGGGGAFPRCGAWRYDCRWYRHHGAADSLVVAVGPAAAGS
jgi:hypothetical protein